MKQFCSIVFLIGVTAVLSNGQLLPSQYSDGACTYPPPAANFTSVLALFATPQVYVSYFMSTSCALRYVQTYLGRPAQNWTEVGKLCYNILFIDSLAVQSGYNQKYAWIDHAVPVANTSTINATNPTSLVAVANSTGVFSFQDTVRVTPGSNAANQETTIQTTVWSDGVKHSLTVSCVLGVDQQWILYSVGPPDQWAKDLVRGIITDLGMNSSLALDYTTDFTTQCTAPPPPPQYTANVLISLGLLPSSFKIPIVATLFALLLSLSGYVYVLALKALYLLVNLII